MHGVQQLDLRPVLDMLSRFLEAASGLQLPNDLKCKSSPIRIIYVLIWMTSKSQWGLSCLKVHLHIRQNFQEDRISVSGDVSRIVENCPISQFEESFKKFLDGASEANDCQKVGLTYSSFSL